MIKVLKSYSKKAEGRHEITRPTAGGGTTTTVYSANGTAANGHGTHGRVSNGTTTVPISGSSPFTVATTVGGAFSENSALETHEHYERKIHRVKKSRSDRDRSAGRRANGKGGQRELIEEWEGAENGSLSPDRQVVRSSSYMDDLSRRLLFGIGVTNEKLDGILYRIEEAESHVKTYPPQKMKEIVEKIVHDLDALEPPIDGFFGDVETLKSERHPKSNEFYQQVFGLHQRRMAYLDRCNAEFNRIGGLISGEHQNRAETERYVQIREKIFTKVEECIQWVEKRLEYMSEMQFVEEITELEQVFEQHKVDHRDIFDFRHEVDNCIALQVMVDQHWLNSSIALDVDWLNYHSILLQAEISADDSAAYCDLLTKLEKEYAQLRELSSGRMLDLDSLIAFVRAAHLELIWINERETYEVSRNWSDLNQLDLPMLQNYYKQLMHEVELREAQFNAVHNQGAALLHQGHPAVDVIDLYLNTMQRQWDWLLALTQCLEVHLQDAINLQQFMEDGRNAEQWMERQMQFLTDHFDRTDVSVEEGERLLRELTEMREMLDRYHEVLASLAERSRIISPLWQRGERISHPMPVHALCKYEDGEIVIRKGDECVLLDNSDMVRWLIRTPEGREGLVPSVVFRLPPPDERLLGYLTRLQGLFERLRRLWMEKNLLIRFNMIMNAARGVRSWDLKYFLSLDPDQREAIIKAINDDAGNFLSELDPNDPLAQRLREEIRLMNEHLMKLRQMDQRGDEPEAAKKFDEKLNLLLPNLEEFWRILNQRVAAPVPRDIETWEKLIVEHKTFEDALQALEGEIITIQELFRQIPNPTMMQRSKYEQLITLWENLWELSKWYAERLKASEPVLNGIGEASHYISEHEIRLGSHEQLPADLDKLRALHSELLEIQLTLQQRQPLLDDLSSNIVRLRQHVAGTRFNVAHHPDVDQIEADVQQIIVRWENICSNVAERLKSIELAIRTMMVYRPSYDNEFNWLNRVEATINNLRDPNNLRPEEYQAQLDILISEYSHLQERTAAIEKVNFEGGRFIRDARVYDVHILQYREILEDIHRGRGTEWRRSGATTVVSGADQVQKELDELNRRFAQLSSIILERRNILQVLMQNYKKKAQEDDDDAERRRRQKEIDDENERRRRQKEIDDENERRRREEEERRRREEEERRRRQKEIDDENERRRREEEERRRRQKEIDDENERRRRQKEIDDENDRRRRENEEKNKKPPPEPPKTHTGQATYHGWESEVPGTIEDEKPLPEVPVFSVQPEEDIVMHAEETEVRTKFYDLDAIRHQQTGEILTFIEAVRQGLLDLRSGEFHDVVSGARMSLQEAVERSFVSQSFRDCLNTRYGLHDPSTHEEITLLEAINRGIYDPESRTIRDPSTGELLSMYDASQLGIISLQNVPKLIKSGILKLPPMTLEHAIEQRVLDLESGTFVGRFSHETLPLRDALRNGYITLSSSLPPQFALSLTDCIEMRFINPNNGEFHDKNTNEKFTLREAVAKTNSLINLNIREIVNTTERKRVPVGEALLRNALNTRQGNFTDLSQRQSMTLQEAYDLDFIQKPLTLKGVASKDLIDSVGRFIDRGTKKRMSLLEAISEGLIDADVPHIIDPESREVWSITEAFENGFLTPEGNFVAPGTNDHVSITDAARLGWLTDPVKASIFDVKGIKNIKKNQTISFNQAVEAGIVQLQGERFVNSETNETYHLSDTVEKARMVDAQLQTILSADSGLKDSHGNAMTVFKAVATGAINPKEGKFIDLRSQQKMSPKEAYEKGMISLRGAMQLTALFNVSPTLTAADRPKKPLKKEIKRGATPTNLSEEVKTAIDSFVRPGSSQEGPTIQESLTEQVTETSQVLAPKHSRDKQSQETVTTVKKKKVKETTATGGPGGAVLYRAITSGKGSLEVPLDGFHILQAEKSGLLDLSSGIVYLPNSDRTLNFEEAVDLGIINAKSVSVRNPKDGNTVSLIQALHEKIIDAHGQIRDGRSGKTMSLQDSINNQHIVLAHEPTGPVDPSQMKVIQFGVTAGAGPIMSFTPIGSSHVEESESSWSFDTTNGEVVDKITGERIRLDEAVRSNKISTDMLRIKDVVTDRVLAYVDAVKWGILDPNRLSYNDKKDNREYTLQEASRRGLIFLSGGRAELATEALETHVRTQTRTVTASKEAAIIGPVAFVDYSLQKVIDLGWYDRNTGMFTHPDSKKQMTLKEAIMKGLFNPYESVVINQSTGEPMSLLDAIQSGVIDASTGQITDRKSGGSVDLVRAFEIGLLKSDTAPAQTLQSVIRSGRINMTTGEVQSPERVNIPLHDAISRGLIDGNSISVKDPQSGRDITFAEAVRSKTIDLSRGLLINKSTGDAVSLLQGIISGSIWPTGEPDAISHARKEDLPVVPKRQSKIHPTKPPGPGQREELVDIGGKQIMVKVIKDDQGVEKGEYIDSSSGMKFTVQLHGDPYVTRTKTTVKSKAKVQQVELEQGAELIGIDQVRDNRTGRIMTLAEAQHVGLAKVDKKGKEMTKSYSVFRSDIVHALNEGVVDPVKGDRLSLADAIRAKLIDIRSLQYSNPVSGEEVDLVQAANMGLLDVSLAEVLPKGVCNPANGDRISINRAIELKIINPKTGEVLNPFSNQKITWLDILKPVYVSLTMEGVYDPRKGYAIPVISALNEGLLKPRTKAYHNPITNETVALSEAVKVGLIDEATYRAITEPSIPDWRSGSKLSLLDAVDKGLVDPHHRTVELSQGFSIPIAKAVEEGKISRDVGARMKRVDKLNFTDALMKGLIDVKSNQYTDPDSGKRMTVAQAIEEGLVDTGNVQSIEGMDEKNFSNIIDSEEFDVNSGRIHDKKSGLYLTFRQAIESALIDGDSLIYDVDNSKTMTLKEAVDRGRIDNNGKFVDQRSGAKVNLKDAIRHGLLALIASPMLAGDAVAEAVKRRENKSKTERSGSPTMHSPIPGRVIDPAGGRVIEEHITTTYRATPAKIIDPAFSLKIKTDVATDRLRSLISDPQAIADRNFEFLENLKNKDFDIEEKIIENPSTGQRTSTRDAVESGLLDVMTGELINLSTGRRISIPRAVHTKMIQPNAAKNIMESLNLSLEELHQIIQTLSPRSDYSPHSRSTSTFNLSSPGAAPSGAVTYSKEVVWHGHPSELRTSQGDLSKHTTITGARGAPLEPESSTARKLVYEDSYSHGYSEPISPDSEYATISEATIREVKPQILTSFSSKSTKF